MVKKMGISRLVIELDIKAVYILELGNSMKMVRRIQKINFCNKYVTGITGKLVIFSLLCKKNYMIICIRINFEYRHVHECGGIRKKL